MSDIVCRGSYRLGSACGACRRCCDQLVHLVSELVDQSPCRYDHNGLCQAHSLHERPCPHETGKHALTTAKHRHGADGSVQLVDAKGQVRGRYRDAETMGVHFGEMIESHDRATELLRVVAELSERLPNDLRNNIDHFLRIGKCFSSRDG